MDFIKSPLKGQRVFCTVVTKQNTRCFFNWLVAIQYDNKVLIHQTVAILLFSKYLTLCIFVVLFIVIIIIECRFLRGALYR